MAEPVTRIPPAILKMLGDNEWRPTDGHSLFDQVWGDEANGHHRGRQRDPSFYYFLKRDLAENNNGVSGREVEALSCLAVFKGLIDAQPEHFAFNEHAQHALTDFCSEVYDAYRKLQERLQMAGKSNGCAFDAPYGRACVGKNSCTPFIGPAAWGCWGDALGAAVARASEDGGLAAQ